MTTAPTPFLRRIPWTLVALTVVVLVAALLPIDPIRDAVTGGPPLDARLERSLGYVVLGPVSGLLDAMTLLTVGEIIGFTLGAVGVYGIARYTRRQTHRVSLAREGAYALLAFVILLAVY